MSRKGAERMPAAGGLPRQGTCRSVERSSTMVVALVMETDLPVGSLGGKYRGSFHEPIESAGASRPSSVAARRRAAAVNIVRGLRGALRCIAWARTLRPYPGRAVGGAAAGAGPDVAPARSWRRRREDRVLAPG